MKVKKKQQKQPASVIMQVFTINETAMLIICFK